MFFQEGKQPFIVEIIGKNRFIVSFDPKEHDNTDPENSVFQPSSPAVHSILSGNFFAVVKHCF
jgi:hypothetical protein